VTRKRNAHPIAERGRHVAKTITADDIAASGKLVPRRGLPGGSGVKPKPSDDDENQRFMMAKKVAEAVAVIEQAMKVAKSEPEDEPEDELEPESEPEQDAVEMDKRLYSPVLKADATEKTVTGVVLQPEVTDAQGDIMDAQVIRKAAEDFLAAYNRATKLGLMHKKFNQDFELLQSFVAPHGLTINNKIVKEGAWVLKVRVKKDQIWKQVMDGQIKGFSIGGKARVVKLAAPNDAPR